MIGQVYDLIENGRKYVIAQKRFSFDTRMDAVNFLASLCPHEPWSELTNNIFRYDKRNYFFCEQCGIVLPLLENVRERWRNVFTDVKETGLYDTELDNQYVRRAMRLFLAMNSYFARRPEKFSPYMFILDETLLTTMMRRFILTWDAIDKNVELAKDTDLRPVPISIWIMRYIDKWREEQGKP